MMSGERTMRMGSADAAWLRMGGPANPMVISALARFEDSLDAGALGELLQRRLVDAYPKFAMCVQDGGLPFVGSLPALEELPPVGPRWKRDPRFAIGRHLHRLAVPSPGDEQALRTLVGDLVSGPLPDDRPPWQAHLIECGDDTALLIRMHHCIADGIALAQVLLSLTDGLGGAGQSAVEGRAGAGEGAAASCEQPPTGAGGLTHALSGAVRAGFEALAHPRGALDLARGGARDVEVLARLLAHPPDSRGAFRGALSGVRRVGWSPQIDLALIKEIAHGNDATVNDVLLAAVAGALRAQLSGEERVRVRMTAIVPFNLRPPQEPVPRELGNRFGLVFVDMPLREGSRRTRLTSVKREMDEVKRSPEGPLTYAVLQTIGLAPAALESRLVGFFSSKASAVIKNVAGPREPRTLAGARLRDLEIWAPASGSVGLSVSLFSYCGQVTVSLLSDAAVLSDPQRVACRVAAEIDALRRLKSARRAG